MLIPFFEGTTQCQLLCLCPCLFIVCLSHRNKIIILSWRQSSLGLLFPFALVVLLVGIHVIFMLYACVTYLIAFWGKWSGSFPSWECQCGAAAQIIGVANGARRGAWDWPAPFSAGSSTFTRDPEAHSMASSALSEGPMLPLYSSE